ncbi:hypothetical protein HBH56_113610 [Parastagonospora nodorum]|uniref:Uncharacterized protein n=1 Tax=Phaeosphaeria nodorum (strain SN15 / ATCC MYA-4574 / FGSC 10173) TaxID=321614 RepID=A0A7U2I4Z9_PHANO|nr:hypothetical protein HBH56_113610 [Parastagonospora nodorum]QRD03606.1 hypothetical protein JI435_419960 [Parastagonospora nodorum SN15]KAH3921538.1 hypothetical protein HBH54_238810 [Parastagonospora nodorum]KAH3979418.1 hypothetical protein HBH52_096910 [Parastagonospora nodorum]KAH3999422.1 hypothetical protein HBI10_116470 [Parastagonospora nodorum]
MARRLTTITYPKSRDSRFDPWLGQIIFFPIRMILSFLLHGGHEASTMTTFLVIVNYFIM